MITNSTVVEVKAVTRLLRSRTLWFPQISAVVFPLSSLLRYGGSMSLQSAMSVRFNSTGTQLLALRRRLPPVLYELHSRLPSFQFDNQGYFNSCTMKSCCFAGDKDQVGRLTYCWERPQRTRLMKSSEIKGFIWTEHLCSQRKKMCGKKMIIFPLWFIKGFTDQNKHTGVA